jgi:hypothetical protein
MTVPSTTNRNERGGSVQRRARKQWLLDTFGDGESAACALRFSDRCLGTVTLKTLTVDRIVPKVEGGTYRRDNIQPCCAPCNYSHGGVLGNQRKAVMSDDDKTERLKPLKDAQDSVDYSYLESEDDRRKAKEAKDKAAAEKARKAQALRGKLSRESKKGRK